MSTLRFGSAAEASTSGLSAMDVADVVLAAALSARVTAVVIQAQPDGHEVWVETGSGRSSVFTLTPELGGVTVERLGLLAGIDMDAAADTTSGRVAVSSGARAGELGIVPTRGTSGLVVEIRRIGPSEAPATTAASAPPKISTAESARRLGHYVLLEKLGEGGAGTVFRAEHVALGKPVAIKILHPEIAQDPTMASVLLSEGRAASRAHNPGIVNVTDYGSTEDGRTYLVMELVEWPTLYRAMNRGWVTPTLAIKITRELLVALDAAHEQGVVHLDLKPENVFVGPEAEVKICDFGTAKLSRAAGRRSQEVKTPGGGAWGTPLYMAPEQAVAGVVDRRADLYAVGCILFEMLSGRPPYDSEDPTQILLQHVNAPIPKPTSPEGASLPDVIVRTVQRALAKDADARYQSAPAMIADLDRCGLVLLRKAGWQQWLPV